MLLQMTLFHSFWGPRNIPLDEWKLLGCDQHFATPWTVTTRLVFPWNSPGENTGVCCYSLLQGIFLTQVLNPGLLYCRQTLYHLSHQRSLFHCICIPYHFYPFICQWTSRSFPCLRFCKQCCCEHWTVYIFLNYSFLQMYAQEWDFRIIWCLYFFQDLHTISHSGYTNLHSLPTVYTPTPSHILSSTCYL